MTATEALERRIDELCAEVERLRGQVASLTDRSIRMADKMDCLDAENAKLRELARDFDKCLTEAVRLAYIQGHATIYDSTLLDSLHPRMRDLKIEVPDE